MSAENIDFCFVFFLVVVINDDVRVLAYSIDVKIPFECTHVIAVAQYRFKHSEKCTAQQSPNPLFNVEKLSRNIVSVESIVFVIKRNSSTWKNRIRCAKFSDRNECLRLCVVLFFSLAEFESSICSRV